MKYNHLTREQRYAIYLGKHQPKGKKLTNKAIALQIGVSESTVSRELTRNSTASGKYVWDKADAKATARKARCPGNRTKDPILMWRVRELLIQEQWSPKQIAGRLRKEGVLVSHETIYKMIREDESGKLARHCRHRMKYARKGSRRHDTKATNIKNRTSIHERPKEADGARFGDWEMDLIVDRDQNAILVLTERSTDRLMMEKLRHGKQAMPTAKAAWKMLLPYKGEGLKTITTDNGSEFAAHEWLTKMLGVTVYFTDSYASWQKGNVENTNKLIRQYIPKGTDISTVTNAYIKKIQEKINSRPREKLNFNTPNEMFFIHYI